MKLISLLILSLISLLIGCNSNVQNDKKYIYYLHGRIIEIQGKNAVSEVYGKYEFDSIVNALRDSNTEVIAEIRTENVDYLQYANKISKEIDSLLNLGIKSKDITVIGASKGAIIASTISNINTNPINYIFFAGNNDYQEEHNDWKFHGQVLCFYDESDTKAGKNYDFWKNKPNYTTKFEQIKIDKKLGHGFLYKPYKDWVEPTKKWIFEQEI
jgi:hypothetical protein